MKLTVQQDVLLKALLHSANVIERRTTVPILSHLLLEASSYGALTITATDLDLSLQETIPAEVSEPGKTTVSAHLLREIIRKFLPQDVISLTLLSESQHLLVENSHSRFELSTLPAEDYPSVQSAEFSHHFMLTCSQLKKLLERTTFAMSTEETRYFLNGIYMHSESKLQELRMVATDGHRMARVYTPLPKGAEDIPGVILSSKTVNEMFSILRDLNETDQIEISLSVSLVRFRMNDILLVSRLIDGAFPDYERITPAGHDKSLLVQVADFARAVDRVSILAQEKTRGVKLLIEGGHIRFSVEGSEHGVANDEIRVDYHSDPLTLGFNATYLLDVANVMKQDGEAEILFGDEGTAVIIRQYQDPEALYVIMPMRI
jgi:DNA polymerase-3 subunit beta